MQAVPAGSPELFEAVLESGLADAREGLAAQCALVDLHRVGRVERLEPDLVGVGREEHLGLHQQIDGCERRFQLGVDEHYRHVGREEVRVLAGLLVAVHAAGFEDRLLAELALARGADQDGAGVVEVDGLEDEAAVGEVAVVGKLDACGTGLMELGLQVDGDSFAVSGVEDDEVLVCRERLQGTSGYACAVGEAVGRLLAEGQLGDYVGVTGEGFVEEAEGGYVAEAADESGAAVVGPVVYEGRGAGLRGTGDEHVVGAGRGDAAGVRRIEGERSAAGVLGVDTVSGAGHDEYLAVADCGVREGREGEGSEGSAEAVAGAVEECRVAQR